ncbi:18228_t:CDS:2 [Funneliformis geosporum]|uniref:7529_t:CDS:1 n=1 Tax=Funneliformis geosporum TaxID=1117311 RepID=A0A9W4T5G6_9GLOM|nr:7529_t:CDS:2 [Funneliformis geosporum]CAI2193070.1 18228_t:CDS:2 [Funneliformis geosporum]
MSLIIQREKAYDQEIVRFIARCAEKRKRPYGALHLQQLLHLRFGKILPTNQIINIITNLPPPLPIITLEISTPISPATTRVLE